MAIKTYKAIIESPEGDNRRRHFDKKRNRVIDIEPLKNVIPINNGIAPVSYAMILDTYCKADNEEIDALIISDEKLKIGEEIDIYPIALLLREDNDNKIVAGDGSIAGKYKEWEDIPIKRRNLIKKFFSFHYKIYKVEDSNKAKEYLLENRKEING